MNPFVSTITNFQGEPCITLGAEDRIRMVQTFNVDQCLVALDLPDLQKTVRDAIERRLRKLAQVSP